MCYQESPLIHGDAFMHSNLTTRTAPILPQKQKQETVLQIIAYHGCFQIIKRTNIKCVNVNDLLKKLY